MAPRIPERPNEEHGIQCEMALAAAGEAMQQAGLRAEDIGAVIVACSNLQRAYPAVSVEVQEALGIKGFGFDMNVACSSATFGINVARDLVAAGTVKRVLVVSPEICTGHLNFRDRESHFIFGDACTAVVVEELAGSRSADPWEILGTRLATKYSNNIRNNFGFLNRAAPEGRDGVDKLFVQQGRKVFKDVSPMVAELMSSHLDSLGIAPTDIRRLWLHQANGTMNHWDRPQGAGPRCDAGRGAVGARGLREHQLRRLESSRSTSIAPGFRSAMWASCARSVPATRSAR